MGINIEDLIVTDADELETTIENGVDSGICAAARGILLPEDPDIEG